MALAGFHQICNRHWNLIKLKSQVLYAMTRPWRRQIWTKDISRRSRLIERQFRTTKMRFMRIRALEAMNSSFADIEGILSALLPSQISDKVVSPLRQDWRAHEDLRSLWKRLTQSACEMLCARSPPTWQELTQMPPKTLSQSLTTRMRSNPALFCHAMTTQQNRYILPWRLVMYRRDKSAAILT